MSEGQGWRKRNVNNESEPIIGNRFSSGEAFQNNGCMKVFALLSCMARLQLNEQERPRCLNGRFAAMWTLLMSKAWWSFSVQKPTLMP
jgi:hypothetical protein